MRTEITVWGGVKLWGNLLFLQNGRDENVTGVG